MTLYFFDAAYAPDLGQVKAHGGVGMSVYLTGAYADTCAQPAALHAAGLGVLGNYEEAPGELPTCGRAGGIAIGQRAAAAYVGKGAPAGVGLVIAFSVDVAVQPGAFGAIGQAFDGISIGLAGRFVPTLYGEGALVDYLVATHRITRLGWLSASTGYPGFNAADPNVGMVQAIGSPVAGTDLDTVTNPGMLAGVWWPPNSIYATEDIVTPADIAAIAAAVWAAQLHAVNGDGTPATANHPAQNWLTGALVGVNNLAAPAVVAQAVVAALPVGPGATLTPADVVTAVHTALAGATITLAK